MLTYVIDNTAPDHDWQPAKRPRGQTFINDKTLTLDGEPNLDIPPPIFRTSQHQPPSAGARVTTAPTKPSASFTRSRPWDLKPGGLDMRVTPVPLPRSTWPPTRTDDTQPTLATTLLSASKSRPPTSARPRPREIPDPVTPDPMSDAAPALVSKARPTHASELYGTSNPASGQTLIQAPSEPNPDIATEPKFDAAPAPASKPRPPPASASHSRPTSGSAPTQAPIANPDTATEDESDDAPAPMSKPRPPPAPAFKPRPPPAPAPAPNSRPTSGSVAARVPIANPNTAAGSESDDAPAPAPKPRPPPAHKPYTMPRSGLGRASTSRFYVQSSSEPEPEDPPPHRTTHKAGSTSGRNPPQVDTAGRTSQSAQRPPRPAPDRQAPAHPVGADGPVPADGSDIDIDIDNLLDLVLHFADERIAARQGLNGASGSSNQAGGSTAASSDLRVRLRAFAQSRTSHEKSRHAQYPRIAQPAPPAPDNDDDDLPEGEDFSAALDAAAEGKKAVSKVTFLQTELIHLSKPPASKSGLGQYSSHVRRVAATAILDMLTSACIKGVYQSPEAYMKWARDGYRRAWTTHAKDRPYERPAEDLLRSVSCSLASQLDVSLTHLDGNTGVVASHKSEREDSDRRRARIRI
jgi:hypothetical protein